MVVNPRIEIEVTNGDDGDRTRDLDAASVALSQLSYIPAVDRVGLEPTTFRVQTGCSPN